MRRLDLGGRVQLVTGVVNDLDRLGAMLFVGMVTYAIAAILWYVVRRKRT